MGGSYLITGTTGVGKSTVARELADLLNGEFVELDHVVAGWYTEAGELVGSRPEDPDQEWVRQFRWCWDLPRLEHVMRTSPGTTVCAGHAENMEPVFDVFDRIFLLCVDAETQQRRLADPSRQNAFAQSAAVRQLMLAHLQEFQPRLAERSDVIAVDARQPLAVIVEDIRSFVDNS